MKSRYDKRLGMINIEPVNERERKKRERYEFHTE